MLQHGGRLRAAARQQGIALHRWLDLSTGLNPHAWPVPALDPQCWARLPEDDDGLEAAARAYYGCDSLLPVAGSQAAIQALPGLRPPSRVRVMSPGYLEHQHAWHLAGHEVTPVSVRELRESLPASDVLVLIHPGNPCGERFSADELLGWQRQLAAHGGWLVLDEAFIDATPAASLAAYAGLPGLIVLRSVGKFFGLAGIRVGFVLAEPGILNPLRERLGPWALSGPSRAVATQALGDRSWQQAMRAQLAQQSDRLSVLLQRHHLAPSGGSALFQWVRTADAAHLHVQLARRAIFTRLFEVPASLRFGLPPDEAGWARLDRALTEINA
ncbi:threonine-phosphate decarboxylase CobD [Marinobacterium sedimentorum]|uniref:threonine-phosphate decarboxylase CobD n=1 Tax=Marinobacterium sedimentorum TaxID=2927804 RepID=UPI0020C5E855|nr:threonine-phosphate decarboxylase CobD [Marinobacterium sedimentorum]MCP8686506.1 threonine-phosphate decarboxylase CobD [Marinobacterium sedimentorum]